jgi:hypothetical protein
MQTDRREHASSTNIQADDQAILRMKPAETDHYNGSTACPLLVCDISLSAFICWLQSSTELNLLSSTLAVC